MKKLLDGVWTWSVWKPGAFRDVSFNGYLLAVGEERVVVDPPPLTTWDLEHLVALGGATRVVVTNANHLRAAAPLCEQFGASLHVPAADADRITCDGATSYVDGDDLFGLRVVGLQDQKTPGESGLYWADRKLLVVGDALIGVPARSVCMLPPAKYADVDAARRGLSRLTELDVGVLLTGDGAPILEDASAAIAAFLGGGAPAATLVQEGNGLVPDGPGWFVLNLGDARWKRSEDFGDWCALEGARGSFGEVGVNVTVLQPNQPGCRYHRETTQEGFLVLHGACRVLIEEEERLLSAWDYVHCPPHTSHVFVGAGDGPCAILMLGARTPDAAIHYPLSALAERHGASVAVATDKPSEAYAGTPKPTDIPPGWPLA